MALAGPLSARRRSAMRARGSRSGSGAKRPRQGHGDGAREGANVVHQARPGGPGKAPGIRTGVWAVHQANSNSRQRTGVFVRSAQAAPGFDLKACELQVNPRQEPNQPLRGYRLGVKAGAKAARSVRTARNPRPLGQGVHAASGSIGRVETLRFPGPHVATRAGTGSPGCSGRCLWSDASEWLTLTNR